MKEAEPHVMRSRIEPMKKIARSMRQHRELILNYFTGPRLIVLRPIDASPLV